MPQLVLLVAVGVGAYCGYRWLKRQVSDASIAASKEAPVPPSERAREAGELVWDEKAGVYRAKD